MSRHDRLLALLTTAAIVVVCGLVIAPWWVRIVVLVAVFLAYLVVLAYMWLTRPPNATDRYLAAVDEHLDERRRRDAQERAAADQLRSQHTVIALPRRPPADVVPFPTDKDAS